jgi:isopenicillin-N epimerase
LRRDRYWGETTVSHESRIESSEMDRRAFLWQSGLPVAVGVAAAACRSRDSTSIPHDNEWDQVRQHFDLVPDQIDMSALFISSHPKPVREAIEKYRRVLDQGPTFYVREQLNGHESEILEAAAHYLNASATDIALTDSTTMGLGLVYNGLKLHPGPGGFDYRA